MILARCLSTQPGHIKFLLFNGDSGVLATLDARLYLTKFEQVKSRSGAANHRVYGFQRGGASVNLVVNTTEAEFKLALLRQQFGQVMKIIKENKIEGQSIIGYLQEKGFPEVALHFVEDKHVRFKLALSCGNLDVAMQSCSNWTIISTGTVWHPKLSNRATIQLLKCATKKLETLTSFRFCT